METNMPTIIEYPHDTHTHDTNDNLPESECYECGETFPMKRALLGYNVCLTCGDLVAASQRASWCIAPIAHKQGATLVTNRDDLKGLNKYSG